MISRTQLLWTTRIVILGFLFRLAIHNCIRSLLVSNYVPSSDPQAKTGFNFTEFFHGRTLHILGDSTVVANLKMVGHPYGVDRMNVERYGELLPFGRFSNGYTIADYIAIRTGSPIPRAISVVLEEEKRRTSGSPIPQAFSGILGNSSTGINFAMEVCGILYRSHQIESLSLSDQILYSRVHVDPTAVGKSLFLLSVGRDDYIFFRGEKSYDYTKEVVARFVFNLEALYYIAGARNIIIINLPPIGCIPDRRNPSSNSCDFGLNKSIGEFNEQLELALRKFKDEYNNATVLLADIQKMFVEIESNPLKFGFTVIDKPCCGAWNSSTEMFQCQKRSKYCDNRNEYLFFDGAYPTDKANRLFVDNCLAGRVCYPIHGV